MATWAIMSIHSRGVSPSAIPRSNSSTPSGISAYTASSAWFSNSSRASSASRRSTTTPERSAISIRAWGIASLSRGARACSVSSALPSVMCRPLAAPTLASSTPRATRTCTKSGRHPEGARREAPSLEGRPSGASLEGRPARAPWHARSLHAMHAVSQRPSKARTPAAAKRKREFPMDANDSFHIAVIAGDGIGTEVMAPALEILRKLEASHAGLKFRFTEAPAGANHYRETGTALPEATVKLCDEADAVLLGACGLPDVRYPHGIDFVVIRESTEGLFASMGKGVVTQDEARETLVITRKTCERLFDFSFRLAARRKARGLRGQLTCVDKANVFKAFAFFRKIFDERAARFPEVDGTHIYIDACSAALVRKPWDFDVLVTENMFGDILSDLAAGLIGGMGMAPSAD